MLVKRVCACVLGSGCMHSYCFVCAFVSTFATCGVSCRRHVAGDVPALRRGGSGATVAVCLVMRDRAGTGGGRAGARMVYAANCGDARAVMCDNGRALRLTRVRDALDRPVRASRGVVVSARCPGAGSQADGPGGEGAGRRSRCVRWCLSRAGNFSGYHEGTLQQAVLFRRAVCRGYSECRARSVRASARSCRPRRARVTRRPYR
jgi:hypothetical protein